LLPGGLSSGLVMSQSGRHYVGRGLETRELFSAEFLATLVFNRRF
jgi:hypothetical protein